jgi:hypothetical protein
VRRLCLMLGIGQGDRGLKVDFDEILAELSPF